MEYLPDLSKTLRQKNKKNSLLKDNDRHIIPHNRLKDAGLWFRILIFVYLLGSVITHISTLDTSMRFPLVFLAAIGIATLYIIDNKLVIQKKDFILITILILPQLLLFPMNATALSLFYLFSFVVNYLVLLAIRQYSMPVSFWKVMFFIVLIMSSIPIFSNSNLSSIFGNSNVLSIILLFEFLLLYYTRYEWKKYEFQLLTIIVIILMLLTNSRSSLLFLVVFYFLYFLRNRITRRSMIFLGIFLFSIILLIYSQILLNNGRFLMDLFSWTSSKGSSLSHRDVIAKAAMEYVEHHFFGLGFGMSNEYLKETIGKNLTPHNTFLKLLMEGGFIYFAANIFIYLYFYFRTKNTFIIAFSIAYGVKMLFESATPLGYSLISVMVLLPFFLKENNFSTKKCYQ